MKPQSRRTLDPSLRDAGPSLRRPSREWLCTYAATALAGAGLASSVLVTTDATSVYEGGSLPQVLVLLVAGLLASFGTILPLPQGQRARGPLVLLAILLAWLLFSTISATWLANGRAAWNGFWHVSALLVFGCLLWQLCRSPKVARAAAELLVLGTIMLSVHAVHQYAVSMPQTRASYQKDPDRALAELNIDAPPGSALRAQYESRLFSTEPLATFALTNSLAVVLSATLVFLGIRIVDQLRRRPSSYVALVTSCIVWLLIMLACLLTKSRTAVLSVLLVAAVSAIVVWRFRRGANSSAVESPLGRAWIVGFAVIALATFAALVALLSRDTLILSEAPKSIAFRLEYWQATSKMILDHPLAGVGLGNFQSYYPRYKLATASETIADPHNWIFDIAACCSLPVVAIVLVALAMMLTRSLALLRQQIRRALPDSPRSESDDGASTLGEADTDGCRLSQALWLGGVLGWFLTAALQWILQEAIDLEAAGLGLIVGAIALVLMRRAGERSEAVPRGAALAAAVTMLLCLLASGSWQASGISLPLIAWLAISGSRPNGVDALGSSATTADERKRWSATWQPAVIGVLLLGFLFQTWRPVNSSWTFEQQAMAAMQRGDMESARQYALASQSADPINPLPYRLVAQTLVSQAERAPAEQFDAWCERVDDALFDLLQCDPVPSLNWSFAAESTMRLAAAAERSALAPPTGAGTSDAPTNLSPAALAAPARHLLDRAAEFQQGAVQRHPSSVAQHAQLAVLLTLVGRQDAAHKEVETAFALSDATPHLDRKMKKQQVWLPAPLAVFPPSAIERPTADSNWVAAEPLCRFLRNKH